tara:strand:+ start:7060 stop:7227 length:168 start_codon:yes stop_codon:yes gene_type:complete
MIGSKKVVPNKMATNNDYRNMLVRTAFEKMKENRIEYSKQSNVYIPRTLQENKKK